MFFVPIPRTVAKERGLKYYFSGSTCTLGNISTRLISNGSCQCKEHYELKLKDRRHWAKKNTNKIKEYDKKDRKKFGDLRRKNSSSWKKKNPDKVNLNNHYRRAIVKQSHIESELTEFVLQETYLLSVLRENISNIKWQVDHMIPLQNKNVCGLHVWNNIQCLPQSLNSSKQNKLIYTNPHEWLYDIPKFFKVVYQQEIAA